MWTFPDGDLSVAISYTSEVDRYPRTCHVTITLDGTWEITSGTGTFAGATGGGTFSGTNRILIDKTPDGCAPPPIALVQVFKLSGELNVADGFGA